MYLKHLDMKKSEALTSFKLKSSHAQLLIFWKPILNDGLQKAYIRIHIEVDKSYFGWLCRCIFCTGFNQIRLNTQWKDGRGYTGLCLMNPTFTVTPAYAERINEVINSLTDELRWNPFTAV